VDSLALRDSLNRLARNHCWTWSPGSRELWSSLDGGSFERHPVQIVADLSAERYEQLLADNHFITKLAALLDALEALLGTGARTPQIAYFSPEFGISEVIRYSGGLGVLAGDHLKASSDLEIPLVGVGLFYRQGFFRQHLDEGRQAERYWTVDPESLGAVATDIVVTVPMPGRDVAARVWRMDVGRTPLILLDTAVAPNGEADRQITDRLYGGGRRHRLEQEMVLGIGGARALVALGWATAVHHLNEGHAGFLALELIDRAIVDGDLTAAADAIRPGLVFTTHTPVPAGIDRFERELIEPYLTTWADDWGVAFDELWALGADPHDGNKFNMATLSLNLASSANGVSKLHGKVSRDLFAGVGIGDEITSVTNGVHARTWVAPHIQSVFDDALGAAWSQGEPEAWAGVAGLDDAGITALRRRGSVHLGELVADRVGHFIDPDSLVVGFARRFATYKRATLLFHHGDRLAALLADDDRPVHFVFAGKAHPADGPGKDLLAEIVAYSGSLAANGRFTFIPDYDIAIARTMYEGCDVWLNTPVRPREASGTSGEKAALNGGLNCSILDGWWDEMYDGQNGWSIATSDRDGGHDRDREESASTLDTLEAVADEYHTRRGEFTQRIRHSWATLGPQVVAARMLRDYRDHVYTPALDRTN